MFAFKTEQEIYVDVAVICFDDWRFFVSRAQLCFQFDALGLVDEIDLV